MNTKKKKKNPKLEFVKSTSSLQKAEKLNIAIDDLRQIFVEVGNIEEMSDDPSFIQKVCELVENVTSISLTGKEKLELALQLITEKFPLLNNEKDLQRLTKQINHMVDSGLIKKISGMKVLSSRVCNFFLKKLDI